MDPSTMDWRFQLLGAFATMLLAVITAVTPLLVRAAIRYVERKLEIDVNDATEAAIERAALQAVAWTEEQARKKLTQNGVPMPGEKKREHAEAFVREALRRQGVSVSDYEIGLAVESALGLTRLSSK